MGNVDVIASGYRRTRRRTVGGRDAGVTRCGGWSSAPMTVRCNRGYLFYLLQYSRVLHDGAPREPPTYGISPTAARADHRWLFKTHFIRLFRGRSLISDGKPESEAADAPRSARVVVYPAINANVEHTNNKIEAARIQSSTRQTSYRYLQSGIIARYNYKCSSAWLPVAFFLLYLSAPVLTDVMLRIKWLRAR